MILPLRAVCKTYSATYLVAVLTTVFVMILPVRAVCKTYSPTYLVAVLTTPRATTLVIKIFLYQYV